MSERRFLAALVNEASRRFRAAGHFAYHYARGKLGGDDIFHELLRRGLLPTDARIVDLGCGQAVLASWLLAARERFERGAWCPGWPEPPRIAQLRGVELMASDVARARLAFGAHHPQVRVEQGDMCEAALGRADAVTILDALHYVDYAAQEALLARVRDALPPGGVLLTRVGDAAAGLPFHICNGVDRIVTFTRGHRLPRLWCRPLAEWQALLQRLGFAVTAGAMNGGKPFANVMLVARLPPVGAPLPIC